MQRTDYAVTHDDKYVAEPGPAEDDTELRLLTVGNPAPPGEVTSAVKPLVHSGPLARLKSRRKEAESISGKALS